MLPAVPGGEAVLLSVRDIVGRKVIGDETAHGVVTDVVLDDRSLDVIGVRAGELWIPIGQLGPLDISSREVQLGPAAAADESGRDPHSCRVLEELRGFAVHATNGAVGTLDDLLIDIGTWQVTHLLVDPHRWMTRRDLVISRDALSGIDWERSRIELLIPVEVAESASKIVLARLLGPHWAEVGKSFVPF
jgi:sporulation protein YlmC with PRC-barrel domain